MGNSMYAMGGRIKGTCMEDGGRGHIFAILVRMY